MMKTNRIKWKSSWVALPLVYQNVKKTVSSKESITTSTSENRYAPQQDLKETAESVENPPENMGISVTTNIEDAAVETVAPGFSEDRDNTLEEINEPGCDHAAQQENISQLDEVEKREAQENGKISGKPVTIQEIVTNANHFTDMINPFDMLEKMILLRKSKKL